ncbi:HEAT repeat domain-containing protein [uncultured Paludibaculum sp.]|uniref:HEAT repeat domain-containing protein n=1 Tax=uncultured Paludibaculum sp. TaxID=1765020 RepID=UPI002AAA7C88|nr:HEAT repeat domain-containing protein [uncultured Paludibaculum sp.]
MPTLLGRALTLDEQQVLEPVLNGLTDPRKASRNLWRELNLPAPGLLFAAVLSLIQVPPGSPEQRALCDYLLSLPGFFPHLSNPEVFSRPDLVRIGRALLKVDPRFDARLAASLFSERDPDTSTILHVLAVLDEISPGGRLTLTLTRLLRDCSPAVASKVAMLLARRVSNPNWVERQLSSRDPRLRANVLESLWGVDTPEVRARLTRAIRDGNNRVVGNAVFGLHLLRDNNVGRHLQGMLEHAQPEFRATAAWVIGKTRERGYLDSLKRALQDRNEAVRESARRALANYPAEEGSAKPAESTDRHGTPTPSRRDEPLNNVFTSVPGELPSLSPRGEDPFDLNLDGTYKGKGSKG